MAIAEGPSRCAVIERRVGRRATPKVRGELNIHLIKNIRREKLRRAFEPNQPRSLERQTAELLSELRNRKWHGHKLYSKLLVAAGKCHLAGDTDDGTNRSVN
jgi:hypothetical protein